jgi:dihydroorotate dehydrogenase
MFCNTICPTANGSTPLQQDAQLAQRVIRMRPAVKQAGPVFTRITPASRGWLQTNHHDNAQVLQHPTPFVKT